MAPIDQARIAGLLEKGKLAPTTKEKGDAFEELICYLFGLIAGISVTRRNERNVFETEEIDVAFFNEQHQGGVPFLPWIFLVECKNWSDPVGSDHVSWFDTKLRNRGVEFGVLFAANGITGDVARRTAAHSIVASALREHRRLIVITVAEVTRLMDSDALVLLVKEKLCDLVVRGSAI